MIFSNICMIKFNISESVQFRWRSQVVSFSCFDCFSHFFTIQDQFRNVSYSADKIYLERQYNLRPLVHSFLFESLLLGNYWRNSLSKNFLRRKDIHSRLTFMSIDMIAPWSIRYHAAVTYYLCKVIKETVEKMAFRFFPNT